MSKREKTTKAKSYTGILNEPMPLPQITLLGRTLEDHTAQMIEAFLHRLVALFNHYGIDPKTDDAWMHLAVALAHNHVPGFQYGERKPGAGRRSWAASPRKPPCSSPTRSSLP